MEDKEVPTACVRKKGITLELAINPDYWETLPDDLQLSLLKHEVGHIVFQHLLYMDLYKDHRHYNIATDCEVNSHIEKIGPNWLHPTKFGLPVEKGTKFYYENIPMNTDQQPLDDHSTWEEVADSSEAEKKLIEDQVTSIIKTTAEQVKKSRGTIPCEFDEIVKEIFRVKERVFDWKSYFRRMLGHMYDVEIKKTRRKESLRYEGAAGLKHKKKIKLMVAIDVSGSVSDNELKEFFSEIFHAYKAGAMIDIVEFDTKILTQYRYNGGLTMQRAGSGGTDFHPPVDLYLKKQKEYQSLIIFTDGESMIPGKTPKDMVWIISSNGIDQEYPGKTIFIPSNNN